ncbi:MAG: hypothetical protein ACP5K1_07080, partial [Candidatus Bathyarchaeia archaeon]
VFFEYKGAKGKGSALKAVMEAAEILGAEAIALVDSDIRSIRPEWMRLLLKPVLKGCGLVTPLYKRHKYDGNITNHLCYPLTYGVYGMDIRQPIGGDFGLSRRLIADLLQSPLWSIRYVHEFGIDIFITHSAISLGYRVEQAFLGSKLHEVKDPAVDLKPMFIQVSGSMFQCMKSYHSYWSEAKGIARPIIYKMDLSFPEPEPVKITPEAQRVVAKEVLREKTPILKSFMPPELMESLMRFELDDGTWCKIVYHIASTFAKSWDQSLLELLYGAWLGRVAYYVEESKDASAEDAELLIKREAETFREYKSYLKEIFPSTR